MNPSAWARIRAASTAGLALALLCAAPALFAQDRPSDPPSDDRPVVSGAVTEPDGRPVLGALVALETPEGRRLRSALTDREGRFWLQAPAPGRYRLRVERLGYRSAVVGPFVLAAGEARREDVAVTGEPIRLQEMDVLAAADRRCTLTPDEGSLLAELWEQTQQAFRRVEATLEEDAYHFRLRRYERSVDIPSGRVSDERWYPGGASFESFRSAPVDELLELGWVRRGERSELIYYGPDLQVLLSPHFQEAFCFRVRTDGARPGQVGIGFEPVRPGSRASIHGTLWIDREPLELTTLEFHYTSHLLAPPLPDPLLELFGGEVELRGLPDGRWVVDRWTLRMPEFRRVGTRTEWVRPADPALAGRFERTRRIVERAPRMWRDAVLEGRLLLREEGGDVERIRTRAGTPLPGRDEAAVAGVVWDSLQVPRRPLEGAVVRLEGTERTATTGSGGRFRMSLPLEGRYRLSFHHPAVDTLEVVPAALEVTLRPGLVEEVELATPSLPTLLAGPCLDRAREEGTGILVGRVRDRFSDVPVPGAGIRIAPAEAGAGPALTAAADVTGTFRFCEVPAGPEYRMTAEAFGKAGDPRRLVLAEPGRILALDAPVDLGIRASVRGRVREGERGPLVSGAEVLLDGPERRRVISDGGGRFQVEELPPGSYRVRVEHLAYRAVDARIEVPSDGSTVTAELRVLPDAIPLAPIHVEVERRSPRLDQVGFYDRMRSGFGSFIDREQIERRHFVRTSQILRTLPRVRTVTTEGAGEIVVFRGSETYQALLTPGGTCPAVVYVDGVRQPDAVIDHVPPDEIEALEVYAGPAQIPAQYATADNACGVILVWLRDR